MRWATVAVGIPVGLAGFYVALLWLPEALRLRSEGEDLGVEWVAIMSWFGNVGLLLGARSAFVLARSQTNPMPRRLLFGMSLGAVMVAVASDLLLVWALVNDRVPW